MKKVVIALMFAALIGSSHLSAAPPAAATDSEYLEELEEIAGQPQDYELVDQDDAPAVQPLALDPFKCKLHPSRVHPRKSGNYNVVGAKPYTRCTGGTPSHISQSSTLYMVEWAGLSYVPLVTKTVRNSNERNLTQKNINWVCKNKNKSRFNQQTKGHSVQRGRKYHSAVQTPIDTWPCGK